VAHLGAHVAIVVGLRGDWLRAVLALLVPPLAPVWGWRAGMRHRVYAWTIALALYAVGVSIS
jgi:hypothetical protein